MNERRVDDAPWVAVLMCVVTQMNYLNKALDVFNTAVVTPIYYVMFTTLTLTASSIMFKDYARQTVKEVISQLCGFVTILAGVFVLHVTKDVEMGGMGAPGSASKRGHSRLNNQRSSLHKSDGHSPGDVDGMHLMDGSGASSGGSANKGLVDMRVNMAGEKCEHHVTPAFTHVCARV